MIKAFFEAIAARKRANRMVYRKSVAALAAIRRN